MSRPGLQEVVFCPNYLTSPPGQGPDPEDGFGQFGPATAHQPADPHHFAAVDGEVDVIISQGSIINRLPKPFLAIGRIDLFGLPSAVFIALGVALVFHVLISKAIFGRQRRAFGFGPAAAVLSGVPTARNNVAVYALCGTLAGLSGLLFTVRVNAAQPNMGGGVFTFEVVTAAIVGGTSPRSAWRRPHGRLGRRGLLVRMASRELLQGNGYAEFWLSTCFSYQVAKACG